MRLCAAASARAAQFTGDEGGKVAQQRRTGHPGEQSAVPQPGRAAGRGRCPGLGRRARRARAPRGDTLVARDDGEQADARGGHGGERVEAHGAAEPLGSDSSDRNLGAEGSGDHNEAVRHSAASWRDVLPDSGGLQPARR